MTRPPTERSFFKYASPEAAEATLTNKTVKFSSPLLFNDPFDVQTGLHFDFEIDTLLEKIIDHMANYACSSAAPKVDITHPIGYLAQKARENFPTLGFNKRKWHSIMEPSFKEDLIPIILNTQSDFKKYWEDNLPLMRVFCISEDKENLLMWSHYAKDHTGVVFEFLSLPERDNLISIAQQVQYVKTPPPFFSEQEWLDDFLTIQQFNHDDLHKKYVLQKSDVWKYEKEWRIWYPFSKTEGLTEYMPINDYELPTMYIGCKATPLFQKNIVTIARANFPNIKIYKAIRRTDSYSLDFTEI